jgi:tryptophan 2,3-dioxygenase
MTTNTNLTYGRYLKIDELLSLQQPRSEPVEHDELLFIVIHQVYELWFKLLLHEFTKVERDFLAGQLWDAGYALKRIRMVLKTLVQQIDVLETMTPRSFASFRERLESASGFQSVQFRELEFFLGYKRPNMVEYHRHDAAAVRVLEARLAAPSLVDAFYRFLAARGAKIPSELLQRDLTQPNQADERIQDELVRLYNTQPDTSAVLELLTDIDEGLQEWRYRHVKMVERTIGNKQGTGGSPGAEFLRRSLFQPLFPDLWAIRHRF